ncbi:hypothetical protein Q3G72_013523 [Acer saccharum]|nr:hypothetical protein Q3G72_013523 [Acer saccharum]
MQDGTPWPGNNTKDHPGMIQVFLQGNELPNLVYVSREKRPSFLHHKRAGAMNALVRVSGVLTNAPFMLNLDCDHYVNDSKAVREAMCFLMDPQINMKGLDGIQGTDKDSKEILFDEKFGKSSTFVTSTLREEGGVAASSSREALLKEVIHVISCDYEDKTEFIN